MQEKFQFNREWAIRELIVRDGPGCQYPSCVRKEFEPSGPWELTLDHTFPQSAAKAAGWPVERIWGLDNLAIYHRKCNAEKGDRVFNDDGTLPPRPEDLRPVHQRRADKTGRVPVCETCMSGRLLLDGEVCYDCGSGPQPSTLPKHLQVAPKDCSHGWGKNPEAVCWKCWLGFEQRRPAIEDVLDTDGL